MSIAAPVFDLQGNVAGALAIYAVQARLSVDQVAAIGKLFVTHAQDLSTFDRLDPRLGDPRQAIGSFG